MYSIALLSMQCCTVHSSLFATLNKVNILPIDSVETIPSQLCLCMFHKTLVLHAERK